MVETRTLEQLPETAIVQGTDLVVVQQPAGPVQSVPLSRVLGRLGPVDVVAEHFADLGLAWDPGKLAIVWGDADPAKLGYYVKTGASGAGAWVYSNVFRGFSAYQLAVASGFVGDLAAWLASLAGADGADGEDGPAGTKYRFGSSIEADVPTANAVLMRHVFNHAVQFPDDFAGSVARLAPAGAAPAAPQVLPIKVNGAQVGSLTVTAAGACVWATTAGALACAIGDEIRLEANAAPVAELLGLSWLFAGTETI